MIAPQLTANQPFRRVVYLVAAVILALLAVDLFVIGGDAFVFNLHSSLNPPFAILVTLTAYALWRTVRTEPRRQRMWTGLTLGWSLWALAETVWGIASLLGQEVPYPSLADLFWVLGYFPMGYGLLARLRETPVRPTRRQRYLVLVVSAVTFAFTFVFVFLPILEYFDPADLVASVLNVLYPLADVFVLSVIWWMFFTYEGGEYGIGWRLLTVGFILMTFSDLVFTYADWNELYYPDMRATLLSRLAIDFPYTVSYLLWIAGIYALRLLRAEERPVVPPRLPRRLPSYGHVLVYTDGEDRLLSASPTFARLFGGGEVRGKTLAEALSISEQEQQTITTKLRFTSKVADLPVHVRDRSGATREVQVSGLAPFSTQREYAGANLVLRARVEDPAFDSSLSNESRGLARHVLKRSGSRFETEQASFLLEYYLAQFRLLLQCVEEEGGEAMSGALLAELQSYAERQGWPLRFLPGTLLEDRYELEALRAILPALLEAAVAFASRAVDPQTVRARLQELSAMIDAEAHRDAQRLLEGENV